MVQKEDTMREYLGHEELIERLKTIKEVLLEHQNAATPDLLDALDTVMDIFKPARNVMKEIDDIFKEILGERK